MKSRKTLRISILRLYIVTTMGFELISVSPVKPGYSKSNFKSATKGAVLIIK